MQVVEVHEDHEDHEGGDDPCALPSSRVMLVMAYTDDYSIGRICERVNRAYADRHGYQFCSEVRPCAAMLEDIRPKLHFTWYKIHLLLQLMREHLAMEDVDSRKARYLCWIDGDAFVAKHDMPIQKFIAEGQSKELIIGEDMHQGCLLNAGVFFVSVSEWSLSFLQDVWECTKYDTKFFYEQSSIIKILKARKEQLERVQPFHSFLPNGPQQVKLFPHVAVFPHTMFNSNTGVDKNELEALLSDTPEEYVEIDENDYPFIYHVAGMKGKLQFIIAAIKKFRVPCSFDEDLRQVTFKLNRTSLGHFRGES